MDTTSHRRSNLTLRRAGSRTSRGPRLGLERLDRRDLPATFTVAAGDVSGLIADINAANGNGESNVIQLAPHSNYTISSVDNNWFGPNALPLVTSNLTIQGFGSIIQRNVAEGPRP